MTKVSTSQRIATSGLLALFSLLVGLAARGDAVAAARTLELRSGTIAYTLVHKLHRVTGTCQKLEGRALVLPDGSARVQVRAPLASFDSGNSNRDAHMREATHELQHPYVTVRGTLSGLSLPLTAPAERTLQATLELNGERRTMPVQVQLTPEGDKVRAKFSFPVSLEAFKIERPELLLIKVDDELKLEGELVFEDAK